MRVLVLGSGILGLSTARRIRETLQSTVVLYSNNLPLETTSEGAGGLWMPIYCQPEELVESWALETFEYLKQRHDSKDPLVEKLEHRHYLPESKLNSYLPTWAKNNKSKFNVRLSKTDSLLGEGFDDGLVQQRPYYWSFDCFVTDTTRELLRLQTMMEEDEGVELLLNQPGINNTEDIVNIMEKYNCTVVVNCTGLGSRRILQDETLVPAKGVLMVFKRPKEATACAGLEKGWISSFEQSCYLILRGDVAVVGGSFYKNDYSTDVSEEDKNRLRQNANLLCPSLKLQQPLRTWAGLRPVRKSGICFNQVKLPNNKIMINNYGHGGSGWTVFHGAAGAIVATLRSLK